jgi:phosphatidylserine/phosphatidylglycerophosphate/cardiolipin synthase-like enzyme
MLTSMLRRSVVLVGLTVALVLAGLTGPAAFAGSTGLRLVAEPQAGAAPFIAMIGGARHSVTLTDYELSDRSVERALAAAAARGVDVRVLLNGGYYDERDSTNAAAVAYLARHRVRVRYTPEYFALTHQKTLTVDGATAAIMTLNFTGDYSTTRDFAVIDQRSADLKAILATFNADWAGRSISPSRGSGDLVWSPGAAGALLGLIEGARRSIDLENEEMDYSRATAALCAAARRGVDVRIVMTYSHEWRTSLDRLSGCGAHVRLYYGQAYYIHAKVLDVDGVVALIGSQNLSTTSLDYNRELSIEVRSKTLLSQLSRDFDSDWTGAARYG